MRRRGKGLWARLREREMFGEAVGGGLRLWQRRLYTCVVPNTTVVNVEKPACFLRKFSPDGRLLIAFNAQQTGVEVWEYRGVQMAGQLLHQASSVLLCHDDEFGSLEICRQLFQTLFRLRFSVPVVGRAGQEQLNRECSLFTPDSRYVILAASLPLQEDQFPSLTELYQNSESLPPSQNFALEDISIYCIDLEEGRVCSTKTFKCDKIFLSHNQGLYLLDGLLAVLSVQHQVIHLFQLENGTGKLIHLQTIGQFLFDDDEMVLGDSGRATTEEEARPGTTADGCLSGFKQRILAFLYREAWERSEENGDPTPLRRFYQRYRHFRWMRLWRMQLLDREHVLLRWATEDVVMIRTDPIYQLSLFVFYNFRTTQVLGVYHSMSPALLSLYEHACDDFRHPDGCFTFPCSISSCQAAWEHHERNKKTILKAKGGSPSEVTKRHLSQLPICAQSFSASPYLDMTLFSYDDKQVSMLERPKQCGDCPVRFYSRQTSQLRFQLHCGLSSHVQSSVHRSLVAFIFHPSDPFAISVQRHNRDYVVNFHLRRGLLEDLSQNSV